MVISVCQGELGRGRGYETAKDVTGRQFSVLHYFFKSKELLYLSDGWWVSIVLVSAFPNVSEIYPPLYTLKKSLGKKKGWFL